MSNVKEIQAAQAALQAAETEAARVDVLIAQREPAADEPAINAEQARLAYEDAAAAVALGDATAETAAAAKAALVKIEQRAAEAATKRQQADALRAGLQRRADAAAATLEAAQARLLAAQIAWAKAELAAADESYATTARALLPAVARLDQLRGWLRGRQVPVAGPVDFEDAVRLEALGPISERWAARELAPGLEHAWNENMLSLYLRGNPPASIDSELADIAAVPPSGIKAALRRAMGVPA